MSTARLQKDEEKKQEKSPLEEHIDYFADENGFVSYSSMKQKFMDMGEQEGEASVKAAKIMALGGAKVRSCPFAMFKPKDAVGALNHARDTGIYQTNGDVNDERWNKLREYAEQDGAKLIVTQNKFYEYLHWCRANDSRWDILGIGKVASNAEWEDFFNKFTNHWKKGKDGLEAAVTLAQFEEFYRHSATAFDRVVHRELPVPRPK